MVSCLVSPSPYRAVRVRALAGDIVFCSWPRYFTLTVPLSLTCINGYQRIKCWGLPCDGLASHLGGSRNTLSLSLHTTEARGELRPDEPLGSYADFTFVKNQ